MAPLKQELIRSAKVSLAGVTLLMGGCAPEAPGVTQLPPVSSAERTQILRDLHAGQPVLYGSSKPPKAAEPRGCAAFRAELETSVVQGELSVPEDWKNPLGRKIQIFYYARLNRDLDGHVTRPVLFLNGGPASDSHSSYRLIESKSTAQKLSMIYLDQRGTGCSSPYPESLDRLKHYGSREIVSDAETVRKALLGQQRWSVLGQSFGSQIAHRYLEAAPEGLTSVHAHGGPAIQQPIDWVISRLRAQKKVSQDYFAVYNDDRARLRSLRASIAPYQCYQDPTHRICGPALLDALAAPLALRPQWPSLHQWLALATSPDTRSEALSRLARTLAFGVYGHGGLASAAISCLELTPGLTDAEVCSRALKSLSIEAPLSPESWPINECRLLSQLEEPWARSLHALGKGIPLSLERIRTQLGEHPELRFFLYSGDEDVFAPPSAFEPETRALGSLVTYKNFPSSGHDGFFSEQSIWDTLVSVTDSI